MNFLPRDICEKLVEKGCKSEGGFYYIKDYLQESVWQIYGNEYTPIKAQPLRFSAFIFQDFCGISEQAIENCKIIFGDEEFRKLTTRLEHQSDKPTSNIYLKVKCGWEEIRERCLSMTWDEWVEFMRKATGEYATYNNTASHT